LFFADTLCIVSVHDGDMSQLNIHVTPAFDRALRRFMRARGIKTKSEAVRAAVEEAARSTEGERKIPLETLLGAAARYPQAPRDQWLTDEQLWGDDGH
jgi:hypothetical protein